MGLSTSEYIITFRSSYHIIHEQNLFRSARVKTQSLFSQFYCEKTHYEMPQFRVIYYAFSENRSIWLFTCCPQCPLIIWIRAGGSRTLTDPSTWGRWNSSPCGGLKIEQSYVAWEMCILVFICCCLYMWIFIGSLGALIFIIFRFKN